MGGGDIDDPPPITPLHAGEGGPNGVKRGRKIDRHQGVPTRDRKFLDRRDVLNAGVVDQYIDAAEARRRDESDDLFGAGDIRGMVGHGRSARSTRSAGVRSPRRPRTRSTEPGTRLRPGRGRYRHRCRWSIRSRSRACPAACRYPLIKLFRTCARPSKTMGRPATSDLRCPASRHSRSRKSVAGRPD